MNRPDDPDVTKAPEVPGGLPDGGGRMRRAVPGVGESDAPGDGEATSLGTLLRDGALRHEAPAALRARLHDDLAKAERHVEAATGISASHASDVDAVRARGEGPDTAGATPGKASGQQPAPSRSTPGAPVRPAEAAWGASLAPWLFGGAGGAILGGLAVAMALLVGRPPTQPEPAPDVAGAQGLQPQEIVASHVRALLSQHPIDVISTDRHTVKPWFNGRIDYAPAVVDLSANGFPLAGGRIDYVGGRTVAVLVYRTDKHPIDVYVFPARDKAAAAPMMTGADGYAIARWRRGGMTYWAITDAEASHLRVFVEALQAAT